MITRRSLLLLPLTAVGARAAEPPSPVLAQVRLRLGNPPVLRGQFEQRKKIAGFKNPLVSRGDFLVLRDRGVFWHTLEPFASTLVLTRDRLVARQADGTVTSLIDTRAEPGMRAINEILFAVVSADIAVLNQRFRIEAQISGADGWSLTLTPVDVGMARFVSRIALQGDRFVRSVMLDESQGDSSLIRFSQQSVADLATPQEVARFD